CVPDFDETLANPRSQEASIRAERHAQHARIMGQGFPHLLTRGHVPDANRPIYTAGSQARHLRIWTKGQIADGPAVGFLDTADFPAGACLEDLDGKIAANSSEVLTVRAKRHREADGVVRIEFLPSSHIPNR